MGSKSKFMTVREINLNPVLKRIFEKTKVVMPKATAHLANSIVDWAHAMWHKDASESGPWGPRYASALKADMMKSTGDGEARVYADEEHANFLFVNLVEDGITSWSIKDALLEGQAARRNEAKYGTRFVRVPFRWRVPGKEKKTSSFAGVMPKDIYEDAKSGIPIVDRTIKVGKRAVDISGLKRFGGEKHGQYMTFRTVSEKSDGWQYPPRAATPVFDQVVAKVEKMLEGMIVNMIKDYEKDIIQTFSK